MAKNIQTLTINPAMKRDLRKLEKLLATGWVIVSQTRRGALQWKPGQVDYVLRKER